MITATERFYELKELSKEAKEKAREWIRSIEREDTLVCDLISEDFQNTLIEEGFMEPEVHWSLGYCQGDGVAFDARVDLEIYMAKHDLRRWGPMEKFLRIYIKDCGHHYHHWNTMDVNVEYEQDYEDDPFGWWCQRHENDLLEHIKERIKEISHELEKNGYAELEYRDSDEYIDEEADRQEYLFDEDGSWVSWKRLERAKELQEKANVSSVGRVQKVRKSRKVRRGKVA